MPWLADVIAELPEVAAPAQEVVVPRRRRRELEEGGPRVGWLQEAMNRPQDVPLVASAATSETTWQRVGGCSFDASAFPGSPRIWLEGDLQVTGGRSAQLRLFDVAAGIARGEVLEATSEDLTRVRTSLLALPKDRRVYEVHLRLDPASSPTADDRARAVAVFLAITYLEARR